jgi:hypothetical protein
VFGHGALHQKTTTDSLAQVANARVALDQTRFGPHFQAKCDIAASRTELNLQIPRWNPGITRGGEDAFYTFDYRDFAGARRTADLALQRSNFRRLAAVCETAGGSSLFRKRSVSLIVSTTVR